MSYAACKIANVVESLEKDNDLRALDCQPGIGGEGVGEGWTQWRVKLKRKDMMMRKPVARYQVGNRRIAVKIISERKNDSGHEICEIEFYHAGVKERFEVWKDQLIFQPAEP